MMGVLRGRRGPRFVGVVDLVCLVLVSVTVVGVVVGVGVNGVAVGIGVASSGGLGSSGW